MQVNDNIAQWTGKSELARSRVSVLLYRRHRHRCCCCWNKLWSCWKKTLCCANSQNFSSVASGVSMAYLKHLVSCLPVNWISFVYSSFYSRQVIHFKVSKIAPEIQANEMFNLDSFFFFSEKKKIQKKQHVTLFHGTSEKTWWKIPLEGLCK